MKARFALFPVLLLQLAILSHTAAASTAMEADEHISSVTVAQLRSEVSRGADTLADVGCFKVEDKDGNLALSAHDRKIARIEIPADSQITLRAREDGDGSFGHVYEIEGVGTVIVTNIDDASFSVSIDDGNQTVSCELNI